jgi:hypothetical protein
MSTYAITVFFDTHPVSRETVHDRLRGTIFGGALGDAIGLYTGSSPILPVSSNQRFHRWRKVSLLMRGVRFLEFLSKDLARQAYPDGKFQLVEPVTALEADVHRCMRPLSPKSNGYTDLLSEICAGV